MSKVKIYNIPLFEEVLRNYPEVSNRSFIDRCFTWVAAENYGVLKFSEWSEYYFGGKPIDDTFWEAINRLAIMNGIPFPEYRQKQLIELEDDPEFKELFV